MRQPSERGDTFFIRGWKVARAFRCDLARDCLDIPGGEAVAKPNETQKRADGGPLSWVRTTALETHAASAPPGESAMTPWPTRRRSWNARPPAKPFCPSVAPMASACE